MAPTPSTIGPAYKGSRVRIENPAAGRASRNIQTLVPRGYKIVENHGSYIVVERVGGQAPPPGYDVNKTPAQNQAAAQKKATEAAAPKPAAPQQVWLDGVLVTVQVDPVTQQYTATRVNGKGDPVKGMRPTAFDALDGQAIEETNPFLMSPGVTTPAGQFGFNSPANHMSIKAGVQWLAELSTKDPGAYASMLQKLYNAGYLSKGDLAAAGGRWSAAAGQAFALAARDTAVVNTTTAGLNTSLDAFLKSKEGAAAAAEAGSGGGKGPYVPVERRYTDPEDLKANSKSVAESVLGRQLTDAEEAELVSHFRTLEDAAYNQIDAAKGESYRITPPGQGQIDAFVDSPGNAQEAAGYRAAEYGLALKRLFGLS